MNPNLATWEILLVGMLAALLVLWFVPGIRAAMQRAEQRKDDDKDWRGALLPLLLVALFVIVLIMLV